MHPFFLQLDKVVTANEPTARNRINFFMGLIFLKFINKNKTAPKNRMPFH
jgi:hypothetical protein